MSVIYNHTYGQTRCSQVLAGKAGLNLNEDQKVDFKIITGFNVSARYDDYKLRLRKLATREYTDVWMGKIGEARNYLLHYFT